jgi:hypothetical protein
MTATFPAQGNMVTDPAFLAKVQAGAVTTAIAIYNEAANTTGHAARVAYAELVLHNPAGYAAQLAPGVASQVPGTTPSDTDISTALSAIWNAYAGV